MNQKLAKTIRVIAMIFMGLTAMMNLLGGAGTVCAAFFTEKYEMFEILDYNKLYQFLMFATIATGVANIWVIMQLAKRRSKSYKRAVIILVIGSILGAVQVFASLQLRGKAIPANFKFYINLFTLILFLIFGIPGLKQKVEWDKDAKPGENEIAGGTAAILGGLLSLTVFGWAGPSHTHQGINWVYEFESLLLVTGTFLLLGGITLIGISLAKSIKIKKGMTSIVH